MKIKIEGEFEVFTSNEFSYVLRVGDGRTTWFPKKACTIIEESIKKGALVYGWEDKTEQGSDFPVYGRYLEECGNYHRIRLPDSGAAHRKYVRLVTADDLEGE